VPEPAGAQGCVSVSFTAPTRVAAVCAHVLTHAPDDDDDDAAAAPDDDDAASAVRLPAMGSL
jgi:hypothetical protein